jgi:hypothetical protein
VNAVIVRKMALTMPYDLVDIKVDSFRMGIPFDFEAIDELAPAGP